MRVKIAGEIQFVETIQLDRHVWPEVDRAVDAMCDEARVLQVPV